MHSNLMATENHWSIFVKYMIQIGRMHFPIWTNIFYNLVFMHSNLMATENHLSIFVKYIHTNWTNVVSNLDKYILQFGQMHLAIFTNTF